MKLEPHGIYVQFDEKLEENFRKFAWHNNNLFAEIRYDILLSPTSSCTIALSDMFSDSISSHLYVIVLFFDDALQNKCR